MVSKTVSLIVPTYNMADYLPALWASLELAGLYGGLSEIVFVNDGSTDATNEVVGGFLTKSSKVKLVDLGKNAGRFMARLKGCEAATSTHVLFIDARVALRSDFGGNLFERLKNHEALMPALLIDTSKSVYNLYWQRTHERIFRKNFVEAERGFHITAENYESYVKGTTAFLCPRQAFLNACRKFGTREIHSDDTFLMKEIVNTYPIWVDTKLAIEWEPRQGYWPFLIRLWERGPQFAEYHVFERQGLFFFLFLGWAIVVFSTLALIAIHPVMGLCVLLSGLITIALSTAIFARTPVEFIRMMPVHVGTILAYGLGAIYGVGVNLNLFRKPPPTAAKR